MLSQFRQFSSKVEDQSTSQCFTQCGEVSRSMWPSLLRKSIFFLEKGSKALPFFEGMNRLFNK